MDDKQTPDTVPPTGGEINDHTSRPTGGIPKNAHAYLILGVAVVMIGAISFSGGSATKPAGATSSKAQTSVIDPSPARIEEFRARMDEQSRRVAEERSRLEQTKRELAALTGSQTGQPGSTGYPGGPQATETREEQERAALEAEKRKREYQSLFASNIVSSNRKDPDAKATPPAETAQAQTTPRAPMMYPWPYPLPPAIAPTNDVKPAADRDRKSAEDDPKEPVAGEQRKIDPSLQKADGKSYRLFEGSIIETVLTNRLDGTFNGPVNCLVTTDVYSHDLQHLLIPKGSRILGEVKRNETLGQQRLAVFFHRIIMPDGYSASLDRFKGLSQIGETGLRDQVNHHYAQIFGVSLAIGAIAGLANLNTGYGLTESSSDAYRQGVSSSLSQSSLHILDRYLNILPTFTIREGHRIKVILSDDLMLPAYDRHTLPPDL